MKKIILTIVFLVLGFCSIASAQNKVVVIPLNGGSNAGGTDRQFQYNDIGNLAGADVYYDDINFRIGIGTTEPKYKMHLHENSSWYSYLTFTNDTTGSGSLDGVLVGIDPGEDFRIHTYEENNIKFFINNSEKLRIANSGYVGIGTNSPNTKLVIQGDGSSWNEGFLAIKNENADAGLRIYDGQDSVRYHIFNVNADDDLFRIVPADNYWEGIALQQDGNVGIGTITPVVKLEVSSVIRSTPTDSPGTCNASIEGAMYYDDSLSEPCFCNGSSWRQFDGGGGC